MINSQVLSGVIASLTFVTVTASAIAVPKAVATPSTTPKASADFESNVKAPHKVPSAMPQVSKERHETKPNAAKDQQAAPAEDLRPGSGGMLD